MLETSFILKRKDWESNFFSFEFGLLEISKDFDYSFFTENFSRVEEYLNKTISELANQFDYLEAIIDTKQYFIIPMLEEIGFRFVDSKCTFITKFNQENLQSQIFAIENAKIRIREKIDTDLKAISDLSVNHMVNDKYFVSKYKSKYFFTEDIAEKYFREWIKNTFNSSNAIFSVAVNEQDDVVGFFIYEQKGELNNLPVYKGILTVVDPNYRGSDTHLSLQSFIFEKIKAPEFYIDNTTQVTNVPIIRNHNRSNRLLNNISFILLRKKSK
jgi:hypothetical protein